MTPREEVKEIIGGKLVVGGQIREKRSNCNYDCDECANKPDSLVTDPDAYFLYKRVVRSYRTGHKRTQEPDQLPVRTPFYYVDCARQRCYERINLYMRDGQVMMPDNTITVLGVSMSGIGLPFCSWKCLSLFAAKMSRDRE